MMSIEAIKKNLGIHASDYLEEQLEEIRHDLYAFANIVVDMYYENPETFKETISKY